MLLLLNYLKQIIQNENLNLEEKTLIYEKIKTIYEILNQMKNNSNEYNHKRENSIRKILHNQMIPYDNNYSKYSNIFENNKRPIEKSENFEVYENTDSRRSFRKTKPMRNNNGIHSELDLKRRLFYKNKLKNLFKTSPLNDASRKNVSRHKLNYA